jgi:hypothetical protein
MPFVLPPGVAIGSQEAVYLRLQWEADQTGGGGSSTPSDGQMSSLHYEQIAEPTNSTALPNIPANAIRADVQNNGSQSARLLDSGAEATATTGTRIYAGDTFVYRGDLSKVRVIREAPGVTLDVRYYG